MSSTYVVIQEPGYEVRVGFAPGMGFYRAARDGAKWREPKFFDTLIQLTEATCGEVDWEDHEEVLRGLTIDAAYRATPQGDKNTERARAIVAHALAS